MTNVTFALIYKRLMLFLYRKAIAQQEIINQDNECRYIFFSNDLFILIFIVQHHFIRFYSLVTF